MRVKAGRASALVSMVVSAMVGLLGLVFAPDAAASPEANGVLVFAPRGQATLIDAANGSVVDTHSFSSPAVEAVWAPDGRRLAVLDENDVVTIYDYPGWTPRGSFTHPLSYLHPELPEPVFDSTGSRLAYLICDLPNIPCTLRVFDVNTQTNVAVGSPTLASTSLGWSAVSSPALAWVRSGASEVVATAEVGGIRTWNPDTHAPGPWVWQLPAPLYTAGISLSPDRTKLATLAGGTTLVVLDVDAGFTTATNMRGLFAFADVPLGVHLTGIGATWAPDSQRLTVYAPAGLDFQTQTDYHEYAGAYTVKHDGTDLRKIRAGVGNLWYPGGLPCEGGKLPDPTYWVDDVDHYEYVAPRWATGEDEVVVATADFTYGPCEPPIEPWTTRRGTGSLRIETVDPDTGGTIRSLLSVDDLADPDTAYMLSVRPRPVAQNAGDTTAPSITCDPVPTGWQADNVTLHCTAADAESGLADPGDASFDLSTSVAAGSEDPAAATGSNEVCDTAGNCATAGPLGPVQVDRKSPTITVTNPTAGQHFSQGAAVYSVVSCTDAGSGVPAGGCSYPAALDTSTAGTKTLHVAAADLVGNAASADVPYIVDAATVDADWVSVAFSGNTSYANARSATSSNVTITKHTNGKIKSISGTATIPSTVSGSATVAFQINCGLPGVCLGKVTVGDNAAGFYRQTPALFPAIYSLTGPNPVPGSPSPYVKAAKARLPWFGWTLTFIVDDRA